MALALHGHHMLLFATLAFATGVLTPSWYTSPANDLQRNVFQICTITNNPNSCQWILLPTNDNQSFRTIFPILIAAIAIGCAGMSVIGLLLSSWYIQRFSDENNSKSLLVLTIFVTLASFLLSCGVWAIMLTTNLHEGNSSNIRDIRLSDFGFSFWINIGASAVYLYALFIYMISICQTN